MFHAGWQGVGRVGLFVARDGHEATGPAHYVVRHLLVRAERVAFELFFGRDDVHVFVRVDFVFAHVPVEFFGREGFVFNVSDEDAAAQLPKILVVAVGRIGCNGEVNVEFLVEALEENSLRKDLARRVGLVIDFPFFGHNLVAYDTGI